MFVLRRVALGLFLVATACSTSEDSVPKHATAAVVAPPPPMQQLTRIDDPAQVCMVNDQHMGRTQIPVEVEGKTYYGCCQACESKLKTEAAFRTATDPQTHHAVDKALAVLAADREGKVLYFENAESLRAFAQRQ